MPRPQKEGIDYFPFDVGFFDDKEKIKPVIAKFGADGTTLLVYMYCEIYKNGYYIKADDDFIDIISMDLRMNKKKIRQMLAYFIKRSLFNDKLFSTVTVLTSGSIQKRYMFAVKERARKNGAPILVKKEYWLIPEEDIPKVNVRTENGLTSIKVIHFYDIPRKNEVIPRKNNSNSVENALKESKEKNNYIYFASPQLDSAFGLYVLSREKHGDTLTEEQITLLKEELVSLSSNEVEQIAILKKATMGNWKSFFSSPKRKKTGEASHGKNTVNKFHNFEGRSYDFSDLEKQLLE